MELKGKHVIVTGGLSGLGQCCVGHLCRAGARVAIFDIRKDGYQKLQEKWPSTDFFQCDLTDSDAVEQAVNDCFAELGRIDVLINNAGILYSEPLLKLSISGIEKHSVKTWQKVIDTNLTSVFSMTVNVAEKMIKMRTKGVIINISSVCAAGNAGQSAYSAAKAGVNALTMTWAKELGGFGIRVAALSPGFFNTESTHQVMSKAHVNEIIKEIPLRRLGNPEEVANGILSIIQNDYFSGSVLELTGGLKM